MVLVLLGVGGVITVGDEVAGELFSSTTALVDVLTVAGELVPTELIADTAKR
jgi:hypothetical protein